jgi:hypothetical protein
MTAKMISGDVRERTELDLDTDNVVCVMLKCKLIDLLEKVRYQ